MQKYIKRDRIDVWSLLLLSGCALLFAWLSYEISSGMPWCVDDGVKRIAARNFSDYGFHSSLIHPASVSYASEYFALAEPFVESGEGGAYRSIFPSLFIAIGGLSYAMFGAYGFYFIPSLFLTGLLWFFNQRLLRDYSGMLKIWAIAVLACPLLFYGMTFWEHGLALLLLIPLFSIIKDHGLSLSQWIAAGVSFGAAVFIRPEAILLYPLFVLQQFKFVNRAIRLIATFTFSGIAALAVCVLFEYQMTGRFLPHQVAFNMGLSMMSFDILDRMYIIFMMIFSFPWWSETFIISCILIVVVSIIIRQPILAGVGLPLISTISILQAYINGSAFAVTAYSQGLFFALPWVIISLIPDKGVNIFRDRMLFIGWMYILLAYFLGPDHMGMHWGPRFLFPALIPLILATISRLRSLPIYQTKWILIVSGLAVVMNATISVFALAERGQASGKVVDTIRNTDPNVVILDRWHHGADLEPLWGEYELVWSQGDGETEELLLDFLDDAHIVRIALLQTDSLRNISNYPVTVVSSTSLPGKAGWNGDLLVIELSEAGDPRWGDLYWHAGRRQAEDGHLIEAIQYLNRAVDCQPANADIKYDLSICYGQMGRIQEAVHQIEETLRLEPDHVEALQLARRLGIRR